MMESLTAICDERILLPCIRSHTVVRTRLCAYERRRPLTAGTCSERSDCAELCFNTDSLPAAALQSAELCIFVKRLYTCRRGVTLRIQGTDDTVRFIDICAPGLFKADVLALIGKPPYGGTLRLALRPGLHCAGLVEFEPSEPAPCIWAAAGAPPCRGPIRIEQGGFVRDFNQSETSMPIDTMRARQFTCYITNAGSGDFTANLETSADAQHWVAEPYISVAPGDTRALIAKYYGSYARLHLCAAGEGKAQVCFIGQYFA